MSKPRILIQFDTDPQPSVFDAVAAIDAGAEHLLRHGGVGPEQVESLIHGAMFTRGPADLNHTAVFIGGSDVAAAQQLLERAKACFFGPLRVSLMLDPGGANTTAAAAVIAAGRHVPLAAATALVLAGTGPVGQRAAGLLALEGAAVRVASRRLERAEAVCRRLAERTPNRATAVAADSPAALVAALDGAELVIAAGAAGVSLLPAELRRGAGRLRVAIDLNAVPPAGIEGVEPCDRATEREGVVCYGALGVGGLKMKIHKAALRRLFERNDLVLDAEELYRLGIDLAAAGEA